MGNRLKSQDASMIRRCIQRIQCRAYLHGRGIIISVYHTHRYFSSSRVRTISDDGDVMRRDAGVPMPLRTACNVAGSRLPVWMEWLVHHTFQPREVQSGTVHEYCGDAPAVLGTTHWLNYTVYITPPAGYIEVPLKFAIRYLRSGSLRGDCMWADYYAAHIAAHPDKRVTAEACLQYWRNVGLEGISPNPLLVATNVLCDGTESPDSRHETEEGGNKTRKPRSRKKGKAKSAPDVLRAKDVRQSCEPHVSIPPLFYWRLEKGEQLTYYAVPTPTHPETRRMLDRLPAREWVPLQLLQYIPFFASAAYMSKSTGGGGNDTGYGAGNASSASCSQARAVDGVRYSRRMEKEDGVFANIPRQCLLPVEAYPYIKGCMSRNLSRLSRESQREKLLCRQQKQRQRAQDAEQQTTSIVVPSSINATPRKENAALYFNSIAEKVYSWRNIVSVAGKKYINAADTNLSTLFDSSFCVQHGIPLTEDGEIFFSGIDAIRERLLTSLRPYKDNGLQNSSSSHSKANTTLNTEGDNTSHPLIIPPSPPMQGSPQRQQQQQHPYSNRSAKVIEAAAAAAVHKGLEVSMWMKKIQQLNTVSCASSGLTDTDKASCAVSSVLSAPSSFPTSLPAAAMGSSQQSIQNISIPALLPKEAAENQKSTVTMVPSTGGTSPPPATTTATTRVERAIMLLRTKQEFAYESPYWIDCATLRERWGVEVAQGQMPLFVKGKFYVNAEQTTDASRFTSVTCTPQRIHSVLCGYGVYSCSWRDSQRLLAVLLEGEKQCSSVAAAQSPSSPGFSDSSATLPVPPSFPTSYSDEFLSTVGDAPLASFKLALEAQKLYKFCNLWVTHELVAQAGWTYVDRKLAVLTDIIAERVLPQFVLQQLDIATEDGTQHAYISHEKLAAVDPLHIASQNHSSNNSTNEGLSAESQSPLPYLTPLTIPSQAANPATGMLRLVNAAAIQQRDELVFVLSYRPLIFIDVAAPFCSGDEGYEEWQRANALAEKAYAAQKADERRKRAAAKNTSNDKKKATLRGRYSDQSSKKSQEKKMFVQRAKNYATKLKELALQRKTQSLRPLRGSRLKVECRIQMAFLALQKAYPAEDRDIWVSTEYVRAAGISVAKPPAAAVEIELVCYTETNDGASRNAVERYALTVVNKAELIWPKGDEGEDLLQRSVSRTY